MKLRLLSGALAVLLFALPLSALVCETCVVGDCSLAAEGDPEQVAEPEVAMESSHCATAEKPASEPPEGLESPLSVVSMECCALVASTPLDLTAISSEVLSQPNGLDGAIHPEAQRQRGEARSHAGAQRAPSQSAPPPLYTLHSVLLI